MGGGMEPRVEELAGVWLQPIAAGARAGQDTRHDPEHEAARAEITKLSGMLDAKVDWARVEQVGTHLLTHKTKDLGLATYLACALHERSGLQGLARGLALLTGMMLDFGTDLFPARPRARANALVWFAERCAIALSATQGHTTEDLALLRALTESLVGAAGAWLGPEAPSLRPLSAAIERLDQSARVTEPLAHAQPAPRPEVLPEVIPTQAPRGHAAEAPVLRTSRLEAEAEVWLAPISEAAPSGHDTAYLDAHARVRTEIQKLESPTGQRTDWPLVLEQAGVLLRTQTKDFVLATYLAAALGETRHLEGLALGVAVLRGLVERYWDTMWPVAARPQRRVNALGWLLDRIVAALSATVPSAQDLPQLDGLEGQAQRLNELLAPHLAADGPSLRPVLQIIARLRASVSEAPAQESGSPAGAAPTAKPVTMASSVVVGPVQAVPGAAPAAPAARLAVPSATDAPQDLGELTAFLRRTGTNLVDAARSLRAADPTNPSAYRLLRAGVWLHIDALPQADAEGRTRIPAPDRKVRDTLDALLAKAHWEPLLAQAEGMAARSPFWLDTHFFAARALEGLGDPFAPAAAALTHGVRSFVEKLPGLLELRFADGAALGSPAALAWLGRTAVAKVPRAAPAGPLPAPAEPSLPEALRMALLRGEAGAAQQVAQLMRGVSSLRAGFGLRLELAELLCESAKLEQAVASYLGLEQDLDAHGIERWEPDLAIRVLRGLWSALERSAQTGGSPDPEARRVCARLARLSPAALLE